MPFDSLAPRRLFSAIAVSSIIPTATPYSANRPNHVRLFIPPIC